MNQQDEIKEFLESVDSDDIEDIFDELGFGHKKE